MKKSSCRKEELERLQRRHAGRGKEGKSRMLDGIRAVDKSRLIKRLGKLDSTTADAVLDTPGELFAP